MIKKLYKLIFPKLIRDFIYKIRLIIIDKKLILFNKDSYIDDGIGTNHYTDFLNDKVFIRSYNEAIKNNELHPYKGNMHYRAYIVCYFAKIGMKNIGNFMELGTGKGIMAKIIYEYTGFNNTDKIFYLCDTFSGIPIELASEKEIDNIDRLNKKYFNKNYYEFIKDKFSMYKNVKLVRGKLPQSLEKIDLGRISFLHIDLNNAYSEIQSFKYLYKNINSGCYVVLDDYAYQGYKNQKIEWDNYAKENNFEILTLPTGQGFFIV